MNNPYSDSDFMTFNDFITRLRKDLNDSDFFAYDLRAPKNENEYQDYLTMCKMLKGKK